MSVCTLGARVDRVQSFDPYTRAASHSHAAIRLIYLSKRVHNVLIQCCCYCLFMVLQSLNSLSVLPLCLSSSRPLSQATIIIAAFCSHTATTAGLL